MAESSLYGARVMDAEVQPEVVAYYFRQWNGFSMPFHTHSAVEIMYAVDGVCRIDTEGQSFELKRNEFIFLDAHVPHRLTVDAKKPCRMLNVEFELVPQREGFLSLGALSRENPEWAAFQKAACPFHVLRDSNEVYPVLKSLVLELDRHGPHSGLIPLLLAQLLIWIARLARDSESREDLHGQLYVKKALNYIHDHYEQDIRVQDIADAIGLHPGYLHRIFKGNTGETVVGYLTRYRVHQAKMMLARTDISVADIAEYVGMGSSQYFSTVFKKLTGQTPMDYRKSVESIRYIRQEGK
ncbi:AraC family transcriptional regulator [Xylanibacillus composti]|uniref:HTH araC/xylS-type domain-containing protein n=1 Tax=Xylanibacillus composti TaxID=1572762 RepID=A0A8J4M472_9BACL|nr:AraC family transcriptional regulator [Xylanibacillus composti]MDT9724574.1 AraC family transcriptional regulator [Xylanibacillus composti]GIQ70266.1 hypothetical protein XYCOK13_30900 [Xylanibacillus composti]